MGLDALQITRSLLSYQVVNDKESLVKLLNRNGIKMPPNPSDAEVTSAVLLASGKSINFKKELASLLSSQAKSAGEKFSSFVGQEMGFTGLDDFSFTGMEGFANGGGPADLGTNTLGLKISSTPTAVTATAGKTKKDKTKAGSILSSIGGFFKDNVLTKENVDAAVQIGLTKINTKTQSKANQVAQEGLVLQQYQDDIRNQQGKTPTKKGLSTGAWIGIGLGAAALVGIVIYFATKKK